MRRFWLPDELIDVHGKNLGPYGIAVYAILARHANAQGEMIVGYRRIAELLGISKNTADKALTTLEEAHLLKRTIGKLGTPSTIKLTTDPRGGSPQFRPTHGVTQSDPRRGTPPTHQEGHKEVRSIKEDIFVPSRAGPKGTKGSWEGIRSRYQTTK